MAHGSIGYTDVHELLEELAWRRRRLALIAAAAVATAGAAPSTASAVVTSDVGGSPTRLGVTISGGTGDDVTVTCDSGNDQVKVNGGNPGTGVALCDSLERIEVIGDGSANTIDLTGDDFFETFGNLESVTLTGGGGADSILGGSHGGAVSGGAGNDTIDAGFGLDLVESADENMTLTDTSLVGGAAVGSDFLLNVSSASLTGGPSANTIDMSGFNGITATIDGAAGADSLLGSEGNDTFTGGLGNDTVVGDRTDELRESRDADMTLTDTSLTIGAEVDSLDGDLGGATLTGGGGDDHIQTQPFTFTSFAGHRTSLEGGGGQDTLRGGDDHDLTGGPGNDSFISGAPLDGSSRVVESGDVNFDLDSTGGQDASLTGNGTDTLDTITEVSLEGGPGANTLDATNYVDFTTLFGGAGADTLRGGSDNDLFPEELGSNDSITGGNGDDTLGQEGINFGGPAYGSFTLTNTLLTRQGGAELDTLSGIDFVGFSSDGGNETVDASAFSGAMEYRSGDGDDSIKGANGFRAGLGPDDIIWGGTGNDTIDGFDGGDHIEANGPASMVVDGPNSTIAGGDGFDTIVGGQDIDALLTGGTGQDQVVDDAEGSVTITNTGITGTGGSNPGTQPIAGAEIVEIQGGPDPDSINASAFDPTNGAFNFFFGTILHGNEGSDTLRGSRGQDQFDGGSGDTDRLVASRDFNLILTAGSLDGDDFFAGGATDTLTGIDEASLTGGAGANQLTATSFGRPVTLRGAGGNDTLTGGSQGDSLEGDGGVDQYFANAGNDLLLTQDSIAESVINCGTGTNTVTSDANDTLAADCGGTPTVPGGGGNPTVPGGGGGNPTVPGGGGGPLILNGCLNTDAGLKGRKLGPATLGTKKSAQRAVFKGAKLSSRPGIDRYCATGGGNFRIGYPTKRLKPSRALLKKINGRVILILTSSPRFSISQIKPGDTVAQAKARLKGERRVKVGKNVWYVAGGSSARLIVKVRGTKVGEVGIGDKRLGKNLTTLKRFLRAWQL